MGTLTTGNIKAGALESSDSPAVNTYVSFANSTVTTYESTAYTAGGQEIETFDFTENGLSTGEAFVYEKSGAGKLQGYPGLCLVSDQVDGSQVFVDRGPSKHQITVAGHTHHDSGGGIFLHNPTSIFFDGTGDYLTVPASIDWSIGSNNWTVEFYVRFNNASISSGNGSIMQHRDGSGTGTNYNWRMFQDSATVFSLTGNASNVSADFSWTPATATWYHVAVVRFGTVAKLFVDGVQTGGNQAYTGTHAVINDTVMIGRIDTSNYLEGYMDDFRIINGKAIYTQDFIPPSRSPKDTRTYGDVADYTKITMMGYRSDSSSYFTAINYVAGDEIVARDYMGIGYDDLQSVAYSGSTQKIIVYNNTTNTVKFTAYVEATT